MSMRIIGNAIGEVRDESSIAKATVGLVKEAAKTCIDNAVEVSNAATETAKTAVNGAGAIKSQLSDFKQYLNSSKAEAKMLGFDKEELKERIGPLKIETVKLLHTTYQSKQWFFSPESKESATVINKLYAIKRDSNADNARTNLALEYLFDQKNVGKRFHDILLDYIRGDILEMTPSKRLVK